MPIIRSKPTYKKNPAPGKPMGYAKIGLKFQLRRKNINLDNKTRFSYLVVEKVQSAQCAGVAVRGIAFVNFLI